MRRERVRYEFNASAAPEWAYGGRTVSMVRLCGIALLLSVRGFASNMIYGYRSIEVTFYACVGRIA